MPVAITAVVTIMATMFGREVLGQLFLSRDRRSTDVVTHLIGVHEKTTDAWIDLARELTSQNTRTTQAMTALAERIHGHDQDQANRFQFTRSALEELCAGLERIEDKLRMIQQNGGGGGE